MLESDDQSGDFDVRIDKRVEFGPFLISVAAVSELVIQKWESNRWQDDRCLYLRPLDFKVIIKLSKVIAIETELKLN